MYKRQELLSVVRANPTALTPDPKVDLRRFRLSASSQLGTKRGTGRGCFIDSVLDAIDGFYETVLQGLRPWTPKAPQLPKTGSILSEAGIDTSVLPTEHGDVAPHDADLEPAVVTEAVSFDDLVTWESDEDATSQSTAQTSDGGENVVELPQSLP